MLSFVKSSLSFFEKNVESYQMLLRVVSKICFEFQQIILEYLHSVARNAKSFLFNLCDRNALSYHKSGYFRTITVLMHPFLQNWIDTKFAGYIEFFDKILEFLEKSLSFRDFLEFFRPWVFRFQRKRKPVLDTFRPVRCEIKTTTHFTLSFQINYYP